MYCDFFGLRCRPFEDRADTHFLYTTPELEETLAAIEYEARQGRGMALVLGAAGTGKTLLIRTLLQRFGPTDHVVALTWRANGQMDLIRETAKGFGVSLPSSHHTRRLLARFRRHLVRSVDADRRSILIIDQAENLTADDMAQLAALAGLRDNDRSLLSILLMGQPNFRSLLDRPEFASLAQQLFGEHVLSTLTPQQTEEYIKHHLRTAGATDDALFEGDALALIHEATGGVPRLINHACNAAMLAAYGAQESGVSRKTVATVTAAVRPPERMVEARDLGVVDAGEVAAGLTGASQEMQAGEKSPTEVTISSHMPDAAESPDELVPFGSANEGGCKADWMSEDTLETMLGSEASVSVKGEGILVRLERALARADRVNVTTEASVAQFTAAQRHLASLTATAERVVHRLSAVVQRSNESLDRVQQRAGEIVTQAEDRLGTVETDISRTTDASNEAEAQAGRVARACEQARDVESRLQSFAEQLADKADEVQERVALLMTGLEAGEATQNRLADVLERASAVTSNPDEVTEALRAKVDEVVEHANEQVNGLGKEASSFAAQVDKQLDLIRSTFESTKAETEHFQTQFTNAVLRNCREKLQERLEDHLRIQRETVEAAITEQHGKLQELTDQSSSQVHAMEEAISTGRQTIEETLDSLGARIDQQRQETETLEQRQREVQSAMATLPDRVADVSNRLEQLGETTAGIETSVDEFTTRADTTQTNLGNIVPQAEKLLANVQGAYGRIEAVQHNVGSALVDIGGACERVNALRDQANQCQDLVSRLATGQAEGQTTTDLLEEALSTARPLLDSLRQAVTDAVEKNNLLELQGTSIGETIDRLVEANAIGQSVTEQVHASALQAEQTTDAAKKQGDELTDLRAAGESAARQLDELIASGRQLHEAMHGLVAHADEKIGQLDSHHAAATNAIGNLAETNRAGQTIIEQANASARQTEEATATAAKQVDKLTTLQTVSESTAEQLDALLASGRQVQESVQSLVGHAEEKIGQLDSRHITVSDTLGKLTDANRAGQTIIEQLADSAARTEQTAETANEKCGQLTDLISASAQITPQLDELVASADRLREAVGNTISNADERIERLEASGAEAANTSIELSVTNDSSRGLLERIEESKGALQVLSEAVKAQTDRVMEDVAAAATQTQGNVSELDQRNATAEALFEKLGATITPAEGLVTSLAQQTDGAKHQIATMAEQCDQVAKLADRLKTVTRLVETAKETESSIKKTNETARSTQDQLVDATNAAKEQSTRLQESSASARSLIETCERLKRETEAAGEPLTAQLEAARKAIETGEPLLNDYLAGTRELQQHLSELQDHADAIERNLTEATARPADIVAEAQAHAAQLERVCAAVRKVFSGLSQASLEVRRHSAECSQATRQAGERLSQLTTETDRAGRMLHEWVEEASHAQARLERTLQQCPSIRETHSVDRIRRLPRSARLGERIANPSSSGELAHLSAPSTTEPAHPGATGTPSTRAEEVSQLIEEARHAVAEVKP